MNIVLVHGVLGFGRLPSLVGLPVVTYFNGVAEHLGRSHRVVEPSQNPIPTPRNAANIDLSGMVRESGAKTAAEAVDYLLWRMLRVPASKVTRDGLVSFLTSELGTDGLERAKTYMEDPLRLTVHLIMSTPEYQLV